MTENTNPSQPPPTLETKGQPGKSRAAQPQKQREMKKGKRTPTSKDPLFKDVISLYFSTQPQTAFSVNPGLQVGQTQLEIDVAVRASESQTLTEIGERLRDTPFFFFAYLNVIEFKSVSDTLYLDDFYRIAARALLAAASYYEKRRKEAGKGKRAGRKAKKQPEEARVVSCLICAAYPQSVQEQLRLPFEPLKGQTSGFYFRPHASELYLPGYLIVCSELPVEEKYYPLLVFAAGNKLSEFIEVVIDRELEVYVKYVAKLHAEVVAEAFARRKRGGQLTTGQERLAETITEILGQDRLAEHLGLERLIAMVQHLEPQVAELAEEQRLSLLRTLMPGLNEQTLRNFLTSNPSNSLASGERPVAPQDKGQEE